MWGEGGNGGGGGNGGQQVGGPRKGATGGGRQVGGDRGVRQWGGGQQVGGGGRRILLPPILCLGFSYIPVGIHILWIRMSFEPRNFSLHVEVENFFLFSILTVRSEF